MLIELRNYTLTLPSGIALETINWSLEAGQHWLLTGPKASGKTLLCHVVSDQLATGLGLHGCAGELNTMAQINGQRLAQTCSVALVSLAQQQAQSHAELRKDDADIVDVIAQPSKVQALLEESLQACPDLDRQWLAQLIEGFNFSAHLERAFVHLSSGETRKFFLLQALARQPELLVLDEPFLGLDSDARGYLEQVLAERSQQAQTATVLVVKRNSSLPACIQHFALLKEGSLVKQWHQPSAAQLNALLNLQQLTQAQVLLPRALEASSYPCQPGDCLVELRQAQLVFPQRSVFSQLDWRIQAGQHWQLKGRNGSGKSCLLALISGDHPQSYSNDIWLFDMQRGSGESVWQIKQHIGMVSNALHLAHRVSVNALDVLLSGFFDSIGLYQQASLKQRQHAQHWLQLIGLSEQHHRPFASLSFGDQRLLLIARAMIKQPPLLLLDEPCSGLDELSRQRVLALIEQICTGSRSTVIYVSHYSEDSIEAIGQVLDLHAYQDEH